MDTHEQTIAPDRDEQRRWRSRLPQLLIVGCACAALLIGALWGFAVNAQAQTGVAVTLVSSADGTSSEADAIAVETLAFAEAKAAFDELPASGATVTLPTTIMGLPGVSLSDTVVISETTEAMIALTGTSSQIFGFDTGVPLDVLVLVDWDETDGGDRQPRVVLSAKLADKTLGELIGLNDGSITATIPLPAGAVTVSNVLDAVLPVDDEVLLDPTSFPTNAQAYLTPIYGSALRDQLPLRGPVNFQAASIVGQISPAVNAATGLAPDDTIVLEGSIAVAIENFPQDLSFNPLGLSLRASTPLITLPAEMGDLLGIGSTGFSSAFEIGASASGTPDDPTDDQIRVAFFGEVETASPLPELTVDVGIEVIETGGDSVAVTVSAGIGDWVSPFDISWLTLNDLSLAGTIEGPRNGDGEREVSAVLRADVDIAGKNASAKLEGTLQEPFNATLTLQLNDQVTLRDMMNTLDLSTSTAPANLLDSSVGPATIVLDLAREDGDQSVVTGTMAADLAFKFSDDAANPLASTMFMKFIFDPTADPEVEYSIGIRPNGELHLSDIVADASPDLQLIGPDAAFGFVFTTTPIVGPTLGDLDPASQQFFGPLYGDDDDATVHIPVDLSVIGSIELPPDLGEFVTGSLGLKSRVHATGTLPLGDGGDLALSLGLELDPAKTPDWVDGGDLALQFAAGANGVEVQLEGSLEVKFRSGLAPEIASGLASAGIDVYSDVPVAADFANCPGAAQVIGQTTPAGIEYRCYDRLAFTVSTGLSVSSTGVSADLTLILDTAVMGNDFGWQPFGLDWLTINRLGLKVGIELDTVAPPPGLKISIGVTGDVEIADKDLFAAAKISVAPVPYPPFAIVQLEGIRLASDAGFELDDFFVIQHELAKTGARVQGLDPASLDGPFSVNDLGIPNLALRNLDFSFSTDGDVDLCIPQGLFISADIYIDPTGEPTQRGAKCAPGGEIIPPPPGSTCGENADNGCIAGGRLAVSKDGFTLLAEINGFELGPIVFDDAVADIALTRAEQHLILRGGVTVDPIGSGSLQVSLERVGLGVQASFAGKLDVGPQNDPFFTGLAEGSAAFDLANFEDSGVELRVFLDASNLSLGELGAAFAAEASTAVDVAAADVIAVLDDLQAARASFQADPGGFVTSEIENLGVTVPAGLTPLIDEIAELVAEGGAASEAAVLRGNLGGFPDGGVEPVSGCPELTSPFKADGRCWFVVPIAGAPAGGLPTVFGCHETLYPFLSGGRCYSIVPLGGLPAGGTAPILDCHNALYPFTSGGRCYSIVPNFFDRDGTPNGGVSRTYDCNAPRPFLKNGRCWTVVPTNGTPSGGRAQTQGCTDYVLERTLANGRCWAVAPFGGSPVGGTPQVPVCPAGFPFPDGSTCYLIAPIDVVGACDAFGLSPDCTADEFIDEVVEPAILNTAGVTKAVFDEVSGVLEDIDSFFKLECAEFQLVLNGQQQSVSVEITMTTAGGTSTFSLAWDLSKPLAENLTELLDGLRNGASTQCQPVDFSDFAADVFQTDGGELLNPITTNTDFLANLVVVNEGETITVDPLAVDTYATTAKLSSVAISTPVSAQGDVNVTVAPDERSVIVTGIGPVPPGAVESFQLVYEAVNASGESTIGTRLVELVGKNDPPLTASDETTLDLRSTTSVTLDVLLNDSDSEGGSLSLGPINTAAFVGCAQNVGGSIEFSTFACGTNEDSFAFLADGQSLVESFFYSAVDPEGASSSAEVKVTVVGRNEAPHIITFVEPDRLVGQDQAISVSGTFSDPDFGDAHQLIITWGDGSASEVIDIATGSRSFAISHSYSVIGDFSTVVIVRDAAGRESSAGFDVSVRGETTPLADADDDNYSADVDCDDGNPAINPGAFEVPYDGIDQNCSGSDLTDVDEDGYSAQQALGGSPDCNDGDATINPGTVEIDGDGKDNDCDGQVDFGLPEGGFVPIDPARILDSRPDQSGLGLNDGYNTPWGPGADRAVRVTGLGGVPDTGVLAVAVHVTSVNPTAVSYLTAYPAGTDKPFAASKNFGPTSLGSGAHAAITNDLLIVKVGENGDINLFNNAGTVDLVVDIVGYYLDTSVAPSTVVSGFVALEPTRLLDSRPTQSGLGSNDAVNSPWGPGTDRAVRVTGLAGIPIDGSVTAVALHVTSVSPTEVSYLTAYPAGAAMPLTASKNYGPTAEGPGGHAAVTNDLLIVKVGENGEISMFNNAGSVDLVIDVVGYYSTAVTNGLVALEPTRILDSRPGQAGLGANDAYNTPWGSSTDRTVQVTGLAGLPTDGSVGAVVLHVTSVNPSAVSFLTAYPSGSLPFTASKNYGPADLGTLGHVGVTNDILVVKVGPNGEINMFNNTGTVDMVVDIVGYHTVAAQ